MDPGRPMGFDGFPLEKMLSKPRRRPMCTSRVASSLEVQGPGPIAASGRGACLPCMLRPQGPVAPPWGPQRQRRKNHWFFPFPEKNRWWKIVCVCYYPRKKFVWSDILLVFPALGRKKPAGKNSLCVLILHCFQRPRPRAFCVSEHVVSTWHAAFAGKGGG